RPTIHPGHLQRPAARRRGYAAPPNMPVTRRSFRSSMTAAIPPACCAGADHGKFFTKLDRLRRVDRGGLAVFPARRIRRGVRADGADVLDIDFHVNFNVDLD